MTLNSAKEKKHNLSLYSHFAVFCPKFEKRCLNVSERCLSVPVGAGVTWMDWTCRCPVRARRRACGAW